MSQVFMNCPNTGRPVYVGLNMEWNALEAYEMNPREMTLKECSECGEDHSFRKNELFLRADGGAG